jgi:exopolysaccharide biosynthesis polyprenyl glycosylphosphotransferase
VLRRRASLFAERLVRLAGDLAVAAAAFYLAFRLRIAVSLPWMGGLLPANRLLWFGAALPWLMAVQAFALWLFGFYEPREPRPRSEILAGVTTAVAGAALALGAFFFLAEQRFPRSVLLFYGALAASGIFLWRSLEQRFARPRRHRVALVGCGPSAREVAVNLKRYGWHGLEVAGHLALPGQEPPAAAEALAIGLGPRIADRAELAVRLAQGEIDDVVLAPEPDGWQTDLLTAIADARPASSSVLLLPGPFESLIGKMRYRWVRDLPLIEVLRETEWHPSQPAKRALDCAAAIVLLLAASPALAVAAIAIRLSSPGPVLYRQERVGRDRRTFALWKLRTMRADAEAATGEVLAERNDPRLTPVGGFLRRTRIDELPQLWNVLAGDMSLVGPRPERPGFVERFLVEVPGYHERFAVRPGLTGLAQVNGEYHSTAANKLRYDLAYIANWSFWLDLSILLRTARTVLTSRGV